MAYLLLLPIKSTRKKILHSKNAQLYFKNIGLLVLVLPQSFID